MTRQSADRTLTREASAQSGPAACHAFQPPPYRDGFAYRCSLPRDHDGAHRSLYDGETRAVWPRAR